VKTERRDGFRVPLMVRGVESRASPMPGSGRSPRTALGQNVVCIADVLFITATLWCHSGKRCPSSPKIVDVERGHRMPESLRQRTSDAGIGRRLEVRLPAIRGLTRASVAIGWRIWRTPVPEIHILRCRRRPETIGFGLTLANAASQNIGGEDAARRQ
jgi:hypothetical protein